MLGAGQMCAIQQDRKDPHASSERSGHFEANEIVWTADTRIAVLLIGAEPMLSDQHDQAVAAFQVFFYDGREFFSQVNAFQVDEDIVVVQITSKSLIDGTSVLCAVASSITDEDSAHGE